MAIGHRRVSDEAEVPYVPRIGDEELHRRNQAAIALLDKWERDGDGDEQRETLQILTKALGKDRVISDRPLFP